MWIEKLFGENSTTISKIVYQIYDKDFFIRCTSYDDFMMINAKLKLQTRFIKDGGYCIIT